MATKLKVTMHVEVTLDGNLEAEYGRIMREYNNERIPFEIFEQLLFLFDKKVVISRDKVERGGFQSLYGEGLPNSTVMKPDTHHLKVNIHE